MLREVLNYYFTPTTPLAKKYGFLYQSIALDERFRRCQRHWLEHLKNCQDVFLEICAELPKKNHVVILGSAHLHEIPWHLLEQNFKEITLVDVIHPRKHHQLKKRFQNLKLITTDLTQCMEGLENLASAGELLALSKHTPDWHYSADLIVSGNLLSQLALLAIDVLEKRKRMLLTIEQKDVICTNFAERHLEALLKCDGRKLVYSDRETFYNDPKGELIYSGSYGINFNGFKKIKEWQWNMAPLKEASKQYSIAMKVEAYTDTVIS